MPPPSESPEVSLADLGWDPAWQSTFETLADPLALPARIAVEEKHFYRAVATHGEQLAQIRGRMLKSGGDHPDLPTVGDWVALRSPSSGGPAVIAAVLPRRTSITRKKAGRTFTEQVLVANVDVALIVQAMDRTFNPRRIERFITLARDGRVRPVIVLNKADLLDDDDAPAPYLEHTRSIAGDCEVLVTSARTGRGLRTLRDHIPAGSTAVLLGVSGAGKSSLINRIYGERIQDTVQVRDDDDKGRHTTTWREMILLRGGGLVIDTPGIRELHLWETGTLGSIESVFPEIIALAASCRFRDCQHQREPGCAVIAASASGSLPPKRYEAYLKLRAEQNTLDRMRRPRRP